MADPRYLKLLSLITAFSKSGQGYDQGQRWTWLDKTNHKIIPGMETDCSATVLGLMWLAGYPVNIDGLAYTGNERELAVAAGWTSQTVEGESVASLDARTVPGQALVAIGGHTIIKAPGGGWLSANIDEYGRIAGGMRGNQTGHEVTIRSLWPYSHGGWTYLLTPPDTSAGTVAETQAASTTASSAQEVHVLQSLTLPTPVAKRLQHVLKVDEDGVIGPKTIAALQARMGTPADGELWTPSELVKKVQGYLNAIRAWLVSQGKTVASVWENLEVDGLIGPKTTAAIGEYLTAWNGAFSH